LSGESDKVFGSSIDSAVTVAGERYAESENAYAYRKALRADCTATAKILWGGPGRS
jgi:hypothetical protein